MEAEKVTAIHGCCPNPLLILLEPQNHQPLPKPKSTTAACRHTFAATTTSSFFPNTHFTNHESLPSHQESSAQFLKAYPKYSESCQVDKIRDQEYYHLSVSNHVCLDYIGIGLFSYSQVQSQVSAVVPLTSSSSSPSSHECSEYPFFDISCKSVDLKSELLHGGDGSQLESIALSFLANFEDVYRLWTFIAQFLDADFVEKERWRYSSIPTIKSMRKMWLQKGYTTTVGSGKHHHRPNKTVDADHVPEQA